MKRTIRNVLLSLGIVLSLNMTNVFADNHKVYSNDVEIKFKENQVFELTESNDPWGRWKGEIMIPLREYFEAKGFEVSWDGEKREIDMQKGFAQIKFINVDSEPEVMVNNGLSLTFAKLEIIDGRTYIAKYSMDLLDKESFGGKSFRVDGEYKSNMDETKEMLNDVLGGWHKRSDKMKSELQEFKYPRVDFSNIEVSNKINNYYMEKILKNVEKHNKNKDDKIVFAEFASMFKDISSQSVVSGISGYEIIDSDVYEQDGFDYVEKEKVLVDYEVFDKETGEKLEIEDILKGTRDEIVDLIIDKCKENCDIYFDVPEKYFREYVEASLDNGFYVDGENLVFDFNRVYNGTRHVIYDDKTGIGAELELERKEENTNVTECKINIYQNKELFKKEIWNFNDEKAKKRAENVASRYYNMDAKCIDKTVINPHSFWVNSQGADGAYVLELANNKLVAVTSDFGRIYEISKGLYKYDVDISENPFISTLSPEQILKYEAEQYPSQCHIIEAIEEKDGIYNITGMVYSLNSDYKNTYHYSNGDKIFDGEADISRLFDKTVDGKIFEVYTFLEGRYYPETKYKDEINNQCRMMQKNSRDGFIARWQSSGEGRLVAAMADIVEDYDYLTGKYITRHYDNKTAVYKNPKAYNIDIEKDVLLSNSEILESSNIEEKYFIENVKQQLRSILENLGIHDEYYVNKSMENCTLDNLVIQWGWGSPEVFIPVYTYEFFEPIYILCEYGNFEFDVKTKHRDEIVNKQKEMEEISAKIPDAQVRVERGYVTNGIQPIILAVAKKPSYYFLDVKCYNLDVENDVLLTNKELLERLGIREEYFVEAIKEECKWILDKCGVNDQEIIDKNMENCTLDNVECKYEYDSGIIAVAVPIYTKDLTKPIYVVLVVDKNEEYEYMKILKDEYSVLIDEKTGLLEF